MTDSITSDIRTFSDNEALVAERRRQIVLASVKLFVRKGYDRTNMRELAKALGMSTGGLYRYIGSKDDICHLIIDYAAVEGRRQFLERCVRGTENLSYTEALRWSIREYFKNANELQDMIVFINHVIVSLSRQERRIVFDSEVRVTDYFEQLLKKGIEAQEFQMGDPGLVAHEIGMAAIAWAQRRWFLAKRYTLQEYTDRYTQFILAGIAGA